MLVFMSSLHLINYIFIKSWASNFFPTNVNIGYETKHSFKKHPTKITTVVYFYCHLYASTSSLQQEKTWD